MRQFWDVALEPILRALAPRRVIEIGVDHGLTTTRLLEFAVSTGAFLDAIDPNPKGDVTELQHERPDAMRLHLGLSVEVIPQLEPPDIAFVDGDHNWFTVHSELTLLERRADEAGVPPPVLVLHDVQWPYARRDLYYDPATIPKPHRHPHEQAGLLPGRGEVVEGGGFNAHLEHAIFEGGEENGVLTAVEDFVAASPHSWKLTVLTGLHGLGILAPSARLEASKPLRDTLASFNRAPALRAVTALVEGERIASEIRRQDLARRLARAEADGEQLATLRSGLQAAEARRQAAEDRATALELARDDAEQDRELGLQRLAESEQRHADLVAEAERDRAAAAAHLAEGERLRAELAASSRRAPTDQHEPSVAAQVAAAARDDALRRLAASEDERRAEQQRRADTERELVAAARDQALLEGRLAAREHEAVVLRDEAQHARSEAAAAASQARVAREAADEQERVRERSDRRRQALEEREEQLEEQLSAARRRQREAADRQDELERANAGLERQLAELERAAGEARATVEAAEAREATRARHAAEAEDARESLALALEDARVEAAEAKHALGELDALREQVVAATIDADARGAQIAELQQALARAHAEAERARAHQVAAEALVGDARPAPAPPAAPPQRDGRRVEPSAQEVAAHEYFRREYDGTVRAPGVDAVTDAVALPAARDLRGFVVGEHPVTPDGPTVDVVVCVHDALDDVRRCLWAVMHKTDRPFRLVVVNDGSDAATTAYLEGVVAEVPAVRLVHHADPPHGYTIAANLGLRAATGDYVVLLNSDTVVTLGWLDRILACGESDPRIGILGPLSNAASHQSVPDLRDAAGWSTNPLPAFATPDAVAELLHRVSPRERPRFPFVNGFCYVIKRAVIDTIGYLDEEHFASGYCEENDYSFRAGEAGFELAVVDDGYVFHAKSKSFGVETRKVIAKRNYQIFLDKHGPERIKEVVEALEANTALAPLRSTVSDAMSSPQDLAAALDSALHHPLKVMFVLPGIGEGGSGGSHSIYQEVHGMRALGLDATIALQAKSLDRARAAYDDAGDVFVPFTDHSSLEAVTAQADVVVATHFKSAVQVAALQRQRQDFLPAYYVQDYEPFFTARESADVEEALASYGLIPGCLLFAKTHWLCNIVSERHGVWVAKVEPSIDEGIYRPGEGRRPGGPLRVTAMVRPRTPRRQPTATVAVLEQLSLERGRDVEVSTFGCSRADLERLTDHPPLLAGHRGLLRRTEVAEHLASSDVFLDLSMYQAFGRTALEAMACGTTAVVPRLGGVWEFLEHERNGIAVDTSAPEQAHAALSALADDHARLVALQAAARQTGERYSVMRAALSEYLVLAREHGARFGRRA